MCLLFCYLLRDLTRFYFFYCLRDCSMFVLALISSSLRLSSESLLILDFDRTLSLSLSKTDTLIELVSEFLDE